MPPALLPTVRQPGNEAAWDALAADVAKCLHRTGCCVVRDPRVGTADNECFLDMMERYFSQSGEAKMADCRPHLHYQVSCHPLPSCRDFCGLPIGI